MPDRRSLDTGYFKPPFSAALRSYLTRGWGERPHVDVEAADVASYAARRRSRLSHCFPGERVVVPSGLSKVRVNDCDHPFRAGSDYVWATGDREPEAVLVLEPVAGGHDPVLYVRPASDRSDPDDLFHGRHGEFYVGRRRTLRETENVYGIHTRHVDRLAQALAGGPARVMRGLDPRVDTAVAQDDPYLDGELAAVLSELRAVKDSWELDQLRAAVGSTVRGFEDVVRSMGKAVRTSERWLEAAFFLRARVEGNDVGYHSIVASGARATALHWTRNDGPVVPGTLLLMDAGVETRSLYTADITRTLPVDGRYTGAQREVYELVLRAQRSSLATVRPGTTVHDFNEAAIRTLAEGLADWGILPVAARESLREDSGLHRRYTRHGIGHMLGLDVHDCSKARSAHYLGGRLAEGHVFTCEPGLYFQHDDLTVPEELRGIGVRIEDDLVVTADGYELLSHALPREPDAVEAWMAALWAGGDSIEP
ncbi:aminopeptidase P family protein [Streptomyces sp. SID3343]|uniref:aminopeptidase P family protein n=1 Tax=Streptomyces sp. SID3343 TaxID=2690260 RepID=UPI00136A205F|nr:aminopeptidase P family protein [Streptomyces sp. SID3343]MYV99144.1 M24 family metallopeptidase [Streptomyces sp. SID3343]